MRVKKIFGNLFLIFFGLILGAVLAESILWIGVKANILKNIPLPSFSFQRKLYWADLNKDFGVWHEPFSRYHHRTTCFDLEYSANSYGARDKERTLKSSRPRVVVLGDSFIEGYGVSNGHRFSDLLEKITGLEFLNFGTAGHFSPTQFYLLYKSLAKKFDHSAVLIALLPGNDFLEDDFEFGKEVFHDRFRPYFVEEKGRYHLIYFDPFAFQRTGVLYTLKRFLSSYSLAYNYFRGKFGRSIGKEGRGWPQNYSGYFNFSDSQFNRLQFVLKKIFVEAQGKRIFLAVMPRMEDLVLYHREGKSPLTEKLALFSKEQGVVFIDLLPLMHDFSQDWRGYFLSCDGSHWSEKGNAVAAVLLKERMETFLSPEPLSSFLLKRNE